MFKNKNKKNNTQKNVWPIRQGWNSCVPRELSSFANSIWGVIVPGIPSAVQDYAVCLFLAQSAPLGWSPLMPPTQAGHSFAKWLTFLSNVPASFSWPFPLTQFWNSGLVERPFSTDLFNQIHQNCVHKPYLHVLFSLPTLGVHMHMHI